MNPLFDAFLDRIHPAGAALTESPGAQIQQEKLLPTVASRAPAMDPVVAERLAQERRKLARLRALGSELVAAFPTARILKGARYGRLYPDGAERFQGDLDLLIVDEVSYVGCLAALVRRGLTMKSGHLTTAPRDDGLYASAIFFEPDASGARGPDSLVVELHGRAFPITPFSHLDLRAEPVAGLTEAALDALVLLAEFVYRDGRTKRFLQRDMLDSLLVFEQLPPAQLPALASALDHSALWVAAGLLRRQLHRIEWFDWPPALYALFDDPRCVEPPADYDMYEHQAWPFWRQRGATRAQFDAMVSAYGVINPRQGPSTLTPFEIGLRFARGVPIAFRPRDDLADAPAVGLLAGCRLLAGPPDQRLEIHRSIGV